MKNYLILSVFIAFIACSDRSDSAVSDCLGTPESLMGSGCAGEAPDGKFCDPRYDGQFQLTDLAKEHLPQYCEDPGDAIIYENTTGDEMLFSIVEKGYMETYSLVNAGLKCEDDQEKLRLVCIEHEKAFIKLQSTDHTFVLELLTLPDMYDNEAGNFGDFLAIQREEVPGLFVGEWLSVVDSRSLSFTIAPCQVFHEEIQLNGKTFQDVTSFEEDGQCAHYQYYLNSTEGLVGFRRSDGILWTIAD